MEEGLRTDVNPDLDLPLPPEAIPTPGIELAGVLHDKQYPALVRFLLMHGAAWSEAQDAAQDAFTQLCAPGVSVTYPRAWLRTVAWRSWVKQQVKLEETCPEMPEPHPSLRWQTPDQAAELAEEERRVMFLLQQLPAKQRAAIAWHLDGFTTEESARAMGTTPAAVRQNLARARTALKRGLRWEGDIPEERQT
ncbi:sigma-70 family RNA polymerase sigma factor [Streptomyces sp. NPDC047002]|uniref:RNA polymerase sigma factor n=1 Tax=Streptomyces sp. NPDC047002 TaxID=3155475 RepID=UPI003456DB40